MTNSIRRLLRDSILIAVVLITPGSTAFAAGESAFEGLFETPEGRIRFRRVATGIAGTYVDDGADGQLSGRVENGRLVLGWQGEETRGEGWIELDENGETFTGGWRATGEKDWHAWAGERIVPDSEFRWLVVLESDWEQELDAPDYAFGEMLEAYFRSNPMVGVRHRRFDNRASLEALLRQVAYLPEPVFLVIAGHGEGGHLKVGRDRIPAKSVGEMLRDVPNVFALHLAACEIMIGGAGEALEDGLAERRIPVSGYGESVDWLGGALIDLLYLDLVLNRDMAPTEAARIVSAQIAFARSGDGADSPLGAAGFQLRAAESEAPRIAAGSEDP